MHIRPTQDFNSVFFKGLFLFADRTGIVNQHLVNITALIAC